PPSRVASRAPRGGGGGGGGGGWLLERDCGSCSTPLPTPPPAKGRSRPSSTGYGGREQTEPAARDRPMTAALDNLASSAERPLARRLRLADPSMILWIAMIAILIFLIASPMVRLVISSFQDPETGRLTLSNYVEAYGRARHLQALWNTLEFGGG